jgi:hypothetical protein
MGVVFVSVLAVGVACVVLDLTRDRRSWQLIAAGLALAGIAFSTVLTPWTAALGVPVLVFVARFLRRGRPRRAPVPMPQEAIGTPEPASNVKLV